MPRAKNYPKICKECGTDFLGYKNQKYCCDKCGYYNRYRNRKNRISTNVSRYNGPVKKKVNKTLAEKIKEGRERGIHSYAELQTERYKEQFRVHIEE